MNTIQFMCIKEVYIQDLSSVMILKLPESFGVEYSSEQTPMNGKLQIMGSVSGQFALVIILLILKKEIFIYFHMT